MPVGCGQFQRAFGVIKARPPGQNGHRIVVVVLEHDRNGKPFGKDRVRLLRHQRLARQGFIRVVIMADDRIDPEPPQLPRRGPPSGPLLQIGTLFVVLGYMFYIEPQVAAIALYSPQFVIVPLFQARLNRLAGEKAITLRALGNFIVDNAEPDLLDKPPPRGFTLLTDKILQIRTRFLMTKNIMKTLNNLLIAMGPFGVIALGGYMVNQGEVEVGVILAFVSGLERLVGPIRDLIGSYASITDARMRYRILLESFPKGIDPEVSEPMPKLDLGIGGETAG